MKTYFKYNEANNTNVKSSYSNGKERIGYDVKRFDCEDEAKKEGYTRNLHDVTKAKKKPKAKKKAAPKEEPKVSVDDNPDS